MKRAIIKFSNDEYINIPADYIDLREGWVMAWCGDNLVVLAKADEVKTCHISEKREE